LQEIQDNRRQEYELEKQHMEEERAKMAKLDTELGMLKRTLDTTESGATGVMIQTVLRSEQQGLEIPPKSIVLPSFDSLLKACIRSK
jgi:hypothetical protein